MVTAWTHHPISFTDFSRLTANDLPTGAPCDGGIIMGSAVDDRNSLVVAAKVSSPVAGESLASRRCRVASHQGRRGDTFAAARKANVSKWNVRRALTMTRILPMAALRISTCAALVYCCSAFSANGSKPDFRVIAFYTAKQDQAHISFVHEAERWFPAMAAKYNFSYDTTSNWHNLNADFLSRYEVVVFLDTRPEEPAQRAAFQAYMERGGAWMGFHFAAFALTPSTYPANWDWYHNTFLGSGSYASNSWRPTSAVLRVEDRTHPATRHLPATFRSSPNEWYRWEKDLRQNPDIHILLSIDSTSFPLGTGPKQHEIWHGGYYPVVWTNRNYRMIYLNMGHNDIDYEHRYGPTNATLSYTLNNAIQDRLIVDALLWLGKSEKAVGR
jgi:hypothetical protein